MKCVTSWTIAMLAVAIAASVAAAQQRLSVTNYLQQGYQVINSTVGGIYLILVLKKDTALVLCSVVIESGQTSGCQTIK
jgi:hypothetical protein